MLTKKLPFIVVLILIGTVLAVESPITTTQPVYTNGEEIELNFPCTLNGGVCPASTVCNVTIIKPNGNALINNQATTRNDSIFVYILNENQTTSNGQYEVSLTCCTTGPAVCQNKLLNFLITPSGAAPISSGQGAIMLAVLGVIFFVTILFFVIAFRFDNVVMKTGGFAFGAIGILVLILYSLLVLNEFTAQSPTLISGFETFYTAMKMIGTALILVLMVVMFLVFAKAWKIRRGLLDK